MAKARRTGTAASGKRRNRRHAVRPRRSASFGRPKRRTLKYEALEDRRLLATVQVSAEFIDESSQASVDSLYFDQDFQLQVYVEDIRDDPGGLFQAYFDVEFIPTLASVTGPPEMPGWTPASTWM